MNSFSRLDVPVVFGSLRDRWFAVVKPPGMLALAAPSVPSVASTLRPFCGEDRELSFPIRPEKDAQGLLIVTADDSMRRFFDDLVRQRRVRSTYRVLADVSTTPVQATVPSAGLPFLGSESLGTGGQIGSLWETDGQSLRLRRRGILRSRIAMRPLRLRVQSGDSQQEDAAKLKPAWCSQRALREALAGDNVPPHMVSTLSKSMLAHARISQGSFGSATPRVAATAFELLSGPLPCPGKPSLRTALYSASPLSSSASHQVRVQFANAGCPLLSDGYYHPSCNEELRRRVFAGSINEEIGARGMNTFGLQLCTLELPDPMRPQRTLRLDLRHPPADWESIHPFSAVSDGFSSVDTSEGDL